MNRSRVRGPYARFCERDEVSIDQLTSPYSIGELGVRGEAWESVKNVFLLTPDASPLATHLG